ncbi:chemotaxis protein CheW [Bacillus sp. B1-b2]|uniref:chemotaxis protein CheW n=1 Tax=Bacillus sp. B1-b2 TaxID=2653201 RepID=UPI0012618640|nr:chemotaxis protein CheW [Bacillus sp. B1-b2]KAB7669949.1 chemotaxis protein CheW [Bacillus sp. B1-b2]
MIDKKVVIFKVVNGEYSIDVNYVISIEKEENITPVPQLPAFVRGLTKVREELIPVIDLQSVLYNRLTEQSVHNKLIVVRTSDMSFAVIVNDAKEILDIKEEHFKNVGIAAYQKTEYITNVINLENRLILMLDPTILLDSLEGVKDIKEFMKNQPA